jgi:hypothetical protein
MIRFANIGLIEELIFLKLANVSNVNHIFRMLTKNIGTKAKRKKRKKTLVISH